MNSLWKHLKIWMCNSYGSWEINLIIWHTVPCFHFHSFTISVKSKVLFSTILGPQVPDGWYPSNMICICFHLSWHLCVHISVSAPILVKTMSQKFHGFWAKSFGDAAKHCWYHNDGINLIINTGEGNLFSVFLMMLPKHVHKDRNSQRRLKSSICFV